MHTKQIATPYIASLGHAWSQDGPKPYLKYMCSSIHLSQLYSSFPIVSTIHMLCVPVLLTALFVFVGWRTIGLGTSFFATPTTRTRFPTSPTSDSPNWVGVFCTFVYHMHLFFFFFCLRCFLGWHAHPLLYARDGWCLRLLNYFRAHRAACLAPACRFPLSFPPCYPHHMHTAPPSCGDVLQIRIAGRL